MRKMVSGLSSRALGEAMIRSDKPTRDKLMAAAKAAGLPLSDYLRVLADNTLKDKQRDIYQRNSPLCGG